MVQLTPEVLVDRLRAGELWRPVRWRTAKLFEGGCCYIKGNTFIQHTPRTIGSSASPAIAGAVDAIRQFGSEWEPLMVVAKNEHLDRRRKG